MTLGICFNLSKNRRAETSQSLFRVLTFWRRLVSALSEPQSLCSALTNKYKSSFRHKTWVKRQETESSRRRVYSLLLVLSNRLVSILLYLLLSTESPPALTTTLSLYLPLFSYISLINPNHFLLTLFCFYQFTASLTCRPVFHTDLSSWSPGAEGCSGNSLRSFSSERKTCQRQINDVML